MFLSTPDGFVTHYRVWRNGSLVISDNDSGDFIPTAGNGQVLVVVHGAMCWGTEWYEPFARQMTNRVDNLTVVVFDLPGHGLTLNRPTRHSSFDRCVLELRWMVEALRITRKVHLLGASRGWCTCVSTTSLARGLVTTARPYPGRIPLGPQPCRRCEASPPSYSSPPTSP